MIMREKNLKSIAEEIFNYAVESVKPQKLIRKNVMRDGSILKVGEKEYNLDKIENIFVIGAGKACSAMAVPIEEMLYDKIRDGVIVVKYGHSLPLEKIVTVEAGHPILDENGIRGTSEILKLISRTDTKDLVICLISGGGSALLENFPNGIELKSVQGLFNLLLKSGANIQEVNTVRKHISKVKGGRLAGLISPAQLVTLILSDVIGDPLDVIASGPTVPDTTTYQNAVEIIKKHNLYNEIPLSIKKHLENGILGKIEETPKPGNKIFDKTYNFIIGNNKIALESAKEKAIEFGFNVKILASDIKGEAKEQGLFFGEDVRKILESKSPIDIERPACLIMGGETTVTIEEERIIGGLGVGGRNQEFALASAIEIYRSTKNIVILSAGTDGTDGPTDAAGAIVDGTTYKKARELGLDPHEFLHRHDSYNFFRHVGGHIFTGPTMTNVMDIMIALIS
jgi:glycerate-2-kinase